MSRVLDEIQDREGEEVTRISYDNGILVYLKDRPFPLKGLPTIECVEEANKAKSALKRLDIMKAYKELKKTPARLLSPAPRELYRVLCPFSDKLAVVISHILEHDQAYRFRFQDLATSTTKEKLLRHPKEELNWLFEIHAARDYPQMRAKMNKIRPLLYLLNIPYFKNLFKRIVQRADFSKLQFDEGDLYWASQKTDYKYPLYY